MSRTYLLCQPLPKLIIKSLRSKISLTLMCQCLRYLCYVRVGPVSSGWYLIFLLRIPSFLNLCHGLAFDLYLWSMQLMSHTLPPRAWGKVLLILATCQWSAGSHQLQLEKKKKKNQYLHSAAVFSWSVSVKRVKTHLVGCLSFLPAVFKILII